MLSPAIRRTPRLAIRKMASLATRRQTSPLRKQARRTAVRRTPSLRTVQRRTAVRRTPSLRTVQRRTAARRKLRARNGIAVKSRRSNPSSTQQQRPRYSIIEQRGLCFFKRVEGKLYSLHLQSLTKRLNYPTTLLIIRRREEVIFWLRILRLNAQ